MGSRHPLEGSHAVEQGCDYALAACLGIELIHQSDVVTCMCRKWMPGMFPGWRADGPSGGDDVSLRPQAPNGMIHWIANQGAHFFNHSGAGCKPHRHQYARLRRKLSLFTPLSIESNVIQPPVEIPR
jgi:hypothetical protein